MTLWPDVSLLTACTEHQRSELAKALAGPVGILAGTPGTGKTFTAAAMLAALLKSMSAWDVAVCAPTGKAAVRLTESLQKNGVNDLEARTIHRTLATSRGGYDGKGWGFRYNRENKLPYRVLVVDEFSMVDAALLSHLLAACESGTHVLFLGDLGQLPPVGPGAPMRDLIAAGCPYGELSEIKRNAGDIVAVCKEIRAGRIRNWSGSDVVDLENGKNLLVRHSGNSATTLNILREMLATAEAVGIDPVWDCQILVSVNEKSDLGRASLNKELQERLNPAGPGAVAGAVVSGDRFTLSGDPATNDKPKQAAAPFRLNDKVICTTNTLLDLVDTATSGGSGGAGASGTISINSREFADDPENQEKLREFVANGEIGKVVYLDDKCCHVEIAAPRRTVIVPFTGKKSEARGDSEHAGAACDFDLAYAITVHKAQGSSARVVIVLVDDYPGARRVGSREHFYTAISRAEQLCIVIGQRKTITADCSKVAITRRKTFLVDLIRKEFSDGSA